MKALVTFLSLALISFTALSAESVGCHQSVKAAGYSSERASEDCQGVGDSCFDYRRKEGHSRGASAMDCQAVGNTCFSIAINEGHTSGSAIFMCKDVTNESCVKAAIGSGNSLAIAAFRCQKN